MAKIPYRKDRDDVLPKAIYTFPKGICLERSAPLARRRGEFSVKVIREIARRAGNMCSFPGCRKLLVGPTEGPRGTLSIGVASHIHAASPGGPRYYPRQSKTRRASTENGIFLCADHARLVDGDPASNPAKLLRHWKADHERFVRRKLGKASKPAIARVSGKHIAAGEGEVTALDIQESAIIEPGTSSIAIGRGMVTGTRIGYGQRSSRRKNEGE